MRFILVLLLFPIVAHPVLANATKERISAKQAYELLRRAPSLANKIIVDPFDISEIADNNKPSQSRLEFTFKSVDFDGGIIVKNKTVAANFRFSNCKIKMIAASGTSWQGSIVFERCFLKRLADFRESKFGAVAKFHSVHFEDSAFFYGSLFESDSEFLGCVWKRGFDFSDSTFLKNASFNKSEFMEEGLFHAVIFEGDASFIEFKVSDEREAETSGIFLNVFFKGDAEFRFCKFDRVDFSNRENITVFHKLADFRGCRIHSASFEYIETRGMTSFVQAYFGKGGVSFDNSVLSGPLTNFDSLHCEGDMTLRNAYIPNIQFRWTEIGNAIVNANPKPKAGELRTLYHRLKKLGRTQEALTMHYDVANRAREDLLENSETGLTDRIWPVFEWIAWGLPTGYGTRFGRILLVTGGFWILFSLPPLTRRSILVRVPPSRKKSEAKKGDKAVKPPRYSPLYLNEIPVGANSPVSVWQHIYMALAFTFSLMFKLNISGIAYLEIERRFSLHGFERYFIVVWFVGSVLIALLVFTLANTSPALSKIIGEILI